MKNPRFLTGGNVTLKDVARRAGVAWSTASYALNGGPKPVSEHARQRVLNAAHALGYSSNLLARGLVTGRMRALGVLVPDLHSYNAAQQLAGVEAQAQEYNYKILLASHLTELDRMLDAQRDMISRRMDGIISVSATSDIPPTIAESLSAADVPMVLTYHAPVAGLAADSLAVDNQQGGCLATRHLLDSGRCAIGFVGPLARDSARCRLSGYRRAHVEAGREIPEALVVSSDSYLAASGLAAGRELLAGSKRPGAVFAGSDSLAAGVLRACHEAGAQVPDDVAVIGFDDVPILCEGLNPSLTSVQMPLVEIGRASVRRLILRLERPDEWEPEARVFPCTLTRRESA